LLEIPTMHLACLALAFLAQDPNAPVAASAAAQQQNVTTRESLVELAFEAVSAMPEVPHARNRCRAQEAERYDVLAMDLPGHGFTRNAGRLDASLDAMTEGLKALLQAERFAPAWIIGHSAGAAIALRLAVQLRPLPRGVVALNGALKPFGGPAALIAPVMAKALAVNPLVHHALARGGRDPARVARLIEATGSRPGADYLKFYGRLFGDPRHVSGTLSMMANWNVSGLVAPFMRAGIAMHQIVGLKDRAVPPAHAEDLARRFETITLERLAGLGHLAHEENAPRVAAAIFNSIDEARAESRKSGT